MAETGKIEYAPDYKSDTLNPNIKLRASGVPYIETKELVGRRLARINEHAMAETVQCCPDWEPNMKLLNGACAMAEIHGAPYLGRKVVFCPWCGRNRIEFEQYLKQKVSEAESKGLLGINK